MGLRTFPKTVHGDVHANGDVKTSVGFNFASSRFACAWARRNRVRLVLHRGLRQKPMKCGRS
jgi:hypothetical protein